MANLVFISQPTIIDTTSTYLLVYPKNKCICLHSLMCQSLFCCWGKATSRKKGLFWLAGPEGQSPSWWERHNRQLKEKLITFISVQRKHRERKQEVEHPQSWSSSKTPPPKVPITSPNIATNCRSRVQTYKFMKDTCYSKHHTQATQSMFSFS